MVILRDPAEKGTSLAALKSAQAFTTDANVAWVRHDKNGNLIRAGFAEGNYLKAGAFTLENPNKLPYVTTATD
jgi:hypothetical protein